MNLAKKFPVIAVKIVVEVCLHGGESLRQKKQRRKQTRRVSLIQYIGNLRVDLKIRATVDQGGLGDVAVILFLKGDLALGCHHDHHLPPHKYLDVKVL